ncbi:acyltransferase family protein [Maritimibacter sp. DP1N21-5]|uniref:acyltransferase family protein n=1 Tax=Maritimibacter sp. DP1N21-5 TaxID=2836867 RepID=UPI001C47AB1F|nr:acyltransferase family protein [Maritimibacter sp. DP1N21-5]MBV7408252.1 acyltransferase [Maritimibacter sp. DP1N21-5]
MKYRPHIDGLRAIAVLPVVAFHLGIPLFSGGYVGVDVFFVISGFLITTILLEDIEFGRYSLLEFYKRRMLRILPALSVVLIVTLVASSFLFFESERIETGKSIVAAATFTANFFFWNDAGYFTAPAETKPLLHTWSLAVEEQFYIFFPPLLFVIMKFVRGYLLQVVTALIILSLLGCIFLTTRQQPTAFYLLPPRAWELGLGAILAIMVRQGRPRTLVSLRVLGPLGLAFTLAPMFLLDSSSAFPGWNAMAPVVGAALLIGWGGDGAIGWILSSRPFVEVGRISYSLYLWHWPLIVFWRAFSGDDLSATETFALLISSCALGALSTYFVERPFRSGRARAWSAPRVTLGGGATLAILAALGVSAAANMTDWRTFPNEVQRIAATADYRSWPDYAAQFRTGSCLIGQADGTFDSFDQEQCIKFDPDRQNVLLIGDSHAAQYWGALKEAMPGANVMQATASGCRALIGAKGAERCTDLRDWVFSEYLPSRRVDMVILGGRWEEAELEYVMPTLEALKQLADRVVVVGPTVEYEGVLPELLARSRLTGEAFDFDALKTPGRDQLNGMMRQLATAAGVSYVDVYGTICDDSACRLFAPDEVLMQFDYGHLTLSGARYVISENSRYLGK